MDAEAGAYTLAARKHDAKRMHQLYVGYLVHSRSTQLLIKLIILVCQGISVSFLLRTDGVWKKK